MVSALAVGVWLVAGAPGQSAAPAAQVPAVVAEIQVHGNLATPEEEILAIAGVTIGTPFDESMPERVAERLRASRRFDGVEVLKRFASITDFSKIVLVIVVDDGPVALNWYSGGGDRLEITRRSGLRRMVLPILGRDDGYGFTYGARLSYTGWRGRSHRLSFPLTWGGHKRATAEYEVNFAARAPVTRLVAGASLSREENPFYRLNDDRQSAWVRAERRVSRDFAAGVSAGIDRVSFADATDGIRRIGADVVFDTRLDPILPRNAVYARAAWDRLDVDGEAVHRREVDLRGYAGLMGQNVVAVRGIREDATGPLPPYLHPLLGGARNVRGFRAGSAADDLLMAASVEIFIPVSSPLSACRAGVSAFMDVGAVYGAGESVHRQKFERAIGGSFWASILFVRMSVAVARGLGSGTRTHVSLGTSF